MTKTLLSILGLLCIALVSVAQTDNITISGTLKGLNNNKLSISWTGDDKENGYLSIQGKGDNFSVRILSRPGPVPARLYVSWPKEDGRNSQMPIAPFNFFLLDKNITLDGEATVLSEIHLKGDFQNELYNNLQQQMATTERRYRLLINQLSDQTIKLSPADSIKMHRCF